MQTSSPREVLVERAAFLKRIPFFANLQEEKLRLIADDFHQRSFKRGATIFRQEAHGRVMFIIREGKIRIFKLTLAGGETSVEILSVGGVFGEFAAIDGLPRSAEAKAISPCTLLQIDGNQLLRRMQEIPELGIAMTRLLIQKLRWTTDFAETVAQYNAAGRLLHILLFYNSQFGCEIEPGKKYELALGLNQTDLASLVGAHREWVNRLLKQWRGEGLLAYEHGTIVILDLEKVTRERDSCIEANRQ